MALMWPMAFPPPLCRDCKREIGEYEPCEIRLNGDIWLGLVHVECPPTDHERALYYAATGDLGGADE